MSLHRRSMQRMTKKKYSILREKDKKFKDIRKC